MPNFKYRAYSPAGRHVAGSIEAQGLQDALQKLKNTGLFPADVREEEALSGAKAGKGITAESLAASTRQLATLISTGTNLSEALGVLAENSANVTLRAVLLKVRENVTEGSSFAKALESNTEVFSPFFRGLVSAGEASGTLDAVLPRLADYLETRARIIREVRSALTYPALMTLVGAGVLSFLFIFVIPRITRMFEETSSSLPFITVLLIGLTGALRSYWWLIASAGGASAYAGSRWLKSASGRKVFERWLLFVPWIGNIARDFYLANFTRTLGSLLKGGVHMLKALEITRTVLDNAVFDSVIENAGRECTAGSSLSSSLKKNAVVPPLLVHMIGVGERSGKLDEMLLRAAESYELSFEAGVKRTITLLEPVLILLMGLAVGFIVLAILLPIFELNQIIR